jgi:ParB/RepB/Spo0J family partition protein
MRLSASLPNDSARAPGRERALVASIAEVGQLVPIAVVVDPADHQRFVVIDGFKRIRARRQLRHDTVRAVCWDLTELEALLLHRSVRSAEGESVLEQAWLLEELRQRFTLTMEDLARQFERTPSWISRRLALTRELPDVVQDEIRAGRIIPHAAAKHLVPMARANRDHCERMARAIAKHGLSSREVGELYVGWRDGSPVSRERLIADPQLFLRTRRALREAPDDELGPREGLLRDVGVLGAVARRARQRALGDVGAELTPVDYDRLFGGLQLAAGETQALVELLHESQGGSHARARHAGGGPGAEEARAVESADRTDAEDLARSGRSGDRVGIG